MAAGDFDGSGRADAAFYDPQSRTLRQFLDVPLRTYHPHRADLLGRLGVNGEYEHVVSGDFNGDGQGDLLFHDMQNGLNRWAQGRQDGTFSFIADPIIGLAAINGEFDHVVAGDFNGDGHDDLMFHAMASGNNRLFFARPGSQIAFDYVGTYIPQTTVNGEFDHVVAGDFDGNGYDDLLFHATASGNNRWAFGSAALRNVNGRFEIDDSATPLIPQSAVNGEFDHVVAADYDGDGRDDLLFHATDSGNNRWAFGRGDRRFDLLTDQSQPLIGQLAINHQFQNVAAGDFNGDGRDDLVFHDRNSGLNRWAYGQGNRTFSLVTGAVVNPQPLTGLEHVAAGDFNGDGVDDLFFHNQPTGRNVTVFSRSPRSAPTAALGDFDGDNIQDRLLRDEVHRWYFAAGNSQATQPFIELGQIDAGWRVAAVGDFDGDQVDDVLLRHAEGSWQFKRMQGGVWVEAVGLGSIDAGWQVAGVQDYDRDGDDDLLITNLQGERQVKWFQNGAWVDYSVVAADAATEARVLLTGDEGADAQDRSLILLGTDFDDYIRLTKEDGFLVVAGVDVRHSLDGVSRIVIHGQQGDDVIDVSDLAGVLVDVYGDSGSDTVHGGSDFDHLPLVEPVAPLAVNELEAVRLTLAASVTEMVGAGLRYALEAAPAGAAIDPETGEFSWTPGEEFGGAAVDVTVRVFNEASSATVTFQIGVSEVNSAPVIGPIGSQFAQEGQEGSWLVPATDADAPVNALTYELLQGPAGATIDAASGLVRWVPGEEHGVGQYEFTVRVTDDGSPHLSDEASFFIVVAETNTAPVIGPIGLLAGQEGQELSFNVSASDPDAPGNALVYELLEGPEGATIDAATGLFRWTPEEEHGGAMVEFVVRVTDNGAPNLSAEATFTVEVTEINAKPLLAPIGNQQIKQLRELRFTVAATDVDLPSNGLAFSLGQDAPAGTTINPATGEFSWTPGRDQLPGMYQFTINVTDNGTPAMTDSRIVNVNVLAPPSTKFYTLDGNGSFHRYEDTGAAITGGGLHPLNVSPRGATADSFGKLWVVDAKKVFVYDTQSLDLTYRGAWTPQGVQSPSGIATAAGHVWIVDQSGTVRRYDGAASRTSGKDQAEFSFKLNAANASPQGIETDGKKIWVVDSAADAVFVYNLKGKLAGKWQLDAANTSATGLTLDPTGASSSIWIVDAAADRVFEYGSGKLLTAGQHSAAGTFDVADPSGLGNVNPIALADPPADAAVPPASPAASNSSPRALREERNALRHDRRDERGLENRRQRLADFRQSLHDAFEQGVSLDDAVPMFVAQRQHARGTRAEQLERESVFAAWE